MVMIHAGEIAACFGCMQQECKSNKRMISAENRKQLNLSLGQFVEFEHNAASAFLQFLQAVLFPLFGFTAAYGIIRLVFPDSGNGIRVLAGFLGLLLAGFGFYVYRKKFPAKNNPVIINVIDEVF
jgi:sigma-E factor negative regulatory protein RseC